ncbi:ERAD-associated protein [Coemansia thaxteri]|nr:ERAD-associated protein [Coemansia thaxteri]
MRRIVRKAQGWLGGGGGASDSVYRRPDWAALPRDVQKAQAAVRRLADAGVEDAQLVAAEMALYGRHGAAVDVDAAFAQYRRLADGGGNATAQYMVGFFHTTGLGGAAQRNDLALVYTALAAMQGHTAAEATLAFRAVSGLGTAADCGDALDKYQAVARKAVAHYVSGPPLGRHLPGYRVRLSDDIGGAYGVRTGPHSMHKAVDRATFDELLEYHQYNARGGSVKAHLTLVDLFYHGHRFAPRDYGAALRHVRAIVDRLFTRSRELRAGVTQAEATAAAQAAGMLGIMSWRGEGTPPDTADAFRWLTAGAALGHATSLNALGLMYRNGVEVPRSAERATELFRQAAAKQHQGGQVNFALAVLDSQPDIALASLRAAADNGHVLAHFYLAGIHAAARGEAACRMAVASYKFVAERADWLHSPVPAAAAAAARGDTEAATIEYMRAAEMGYDVAQLNAALLLDHVARRVGSSPLFASRAAIERQALVYWTRAANQNVPDARTKQGDAYFYGRGAARSHERAAAAYTLAAKSEASALAMWNLGWMHEHGVGVKRDFHLAKRWYDMSLEASDSGRLAAHASLARLCLRYLWAWATGQDVGDGPLFFAPRPVSREEEERVANANANADARHANRYDNDAWEHAAAADADTDTDAGADAESESDAGGSMGESVFFIAFLVGAAWMFLPLR